MSAPTEYNSENNFSFELNDLSFLSIDYIPKKIKSI